MQSFNFNRTKVKINYSISAYGGLPNTDIYELALDDLKNHFLVRAFLLIEGFSIKEITQAKHNLKKRGVE